MYCISENYVPVQPYTESMFMSFEVYNGSRDYLCEASLEFEARRSLSTTRDHRPTLFVSVHPNSLTCTYPDTRNAHLSAERKRTFNAWKPSWLRRGRNQPQRASGVKRYSIKFKHPCLSMMMNKLDYWRLQVKVKISSIESWTVTVM